MKLNADLIIFSLNFFPIISLYIIIIMLSISILFYVLQVSYKLEVEMSVAKEKRKRKRIRVYKFMQYRKATLSSYPDLGTTR